MKCKNRCGKTLKGRPDKKFCSDKCRNNYNNRRRAKDKMGALKKRLSNLLNQKNNWELSPSDNRLRNHLNKYQ